MMAGQLISVRRFRTATGIVQPPEREAERPRRYAALALIFRRARHFKTENSSPPIFVSVDGRRITITPRIALHVHQHAELRRSLPNGVGLARASQAREFRGGLGPKGVTLGRLIERRTLHRFQGNLHAASLAAVRRQGESDDIIRHRSHVRQKAMIFAEHQVLELFRMSGQRSSRLLTPLHQRHTEKTFDYPVPLPGLPVSAQKRARVGVFYPNPAGIETMAFATRSRLAVRTVAGKAGSDGEAVHSWFRPVVRRSASSPADRETLSDRPLARRRAPLLFARGRASLKETLSAADPSSSLRSGIAAAPMNYRAPPPIPKADVKPATPEAAPAKPAIPPVDVDRISTEVIRRIERQSRIERERRGLL